MFGNIRTYYTFVQPRQIQFLRRKVVFFAWLMRPKRRSLSRRVRRKLNFPGKPCLIRVSETVVQIHGNCVLNIWRENSAKTEIDGTGETRVRRLTPIRVKIAFDSTQNIILCCTGNSLSPPAHVYNIRYYVIVVPIARLGEKPTIFCLEKNFADRQVAIQHPSTLHNFMRTRQ
jgi:hypothetical protein